MTENEAIEEIKKKICGERPTQHICSDGCMKGNDKCALSVAIKALEEVQQYRKNGITVENAVENMCNLICAESLIAEYRAIGTPEELQDMKNNYFEALSDWRQYRKIGTLEECRKSVEIYKAMIERNITPENMEEYMKFEDECTSKGFTFNSLLEAREKQTAKKPTLIDYKKYTNFVDNADFLRDAYWCPNCERVVRSGSFCDDCGQHLDWSDVE